jgi:hypothetical protein
VHGISDKGIGVQGESTAVEGVRGQGKNGVHGISSSKTDSGVWGENTGAGYGVSGSTTSDFQPGPNVTAGVWGNNAGSGAGIKGSSTSGDGVSGFSSANNHAGVSAVNDGGGHGLSASSSKTGGIGVYAAGAKYAAQFDGAVQVNGDHHCTGTLTAKVDVVLGSDCAEDFDIAGCGEIEPGTVMVLTENDALEPSLSAYDKKVAGVISGAGDCQPGLILGRKGSSQSRRPLALVGKVYCKVDAQYGPIAVGDLLTTSPTPGHAMLATDPLKAFGAVIGKALRPLPYGQGLVPILVALQ